MSERIETLETTTDDDVAFARLATRMALAGFGLMFAAAFIMWMSFGPMIFIDLATAVVNCF